MRDKCGEIWNFSLSVMWKFLHVTNVKKFIKISHLLYHYQINNVYHCWCFNQFMLFCCKISFVSKSFQSRFLHFCVEKNWAQMWRKVTNMRYAQNLNKWKAAVLNSLDQKDCDLKILARDFPRSISASAASSHQQHQHISSISASAE